MHVSLPLWGFWIGVPRSATGPTGRPIRLGKPVKIRAWAGFLRGSLSFRCPHDLTDVERFRSQAKECRRLAERTTSPIDKEAWLRLAEDWIKLAEKTEKRRQAGGQ